MVLTNNVAETKTVITTTSQQAPLAQPVMAPGSNTMINKGAMLNNTINKEAIITNVMEKPVLENVIEKKNVEVHHKNVVQEIHEQKIIEIQKQPMIQQVNKGTLIEQQKAETRFEEIGTGAIGEQERLRLEQLRLSSAPKITQQQGAVRQVAEGEVIQQVVKQEFIERHVQPVITEVREQNIVQEVVHPVVRKIHEAPIIREVSTTAPVQQNLLQKSTFVESSRLQNAPLQTGLVQGTTMTGTTTTQKAGLVQNVKEHLHMGQQTGLINQQQGFVQQPLMTGNTMPLSSQAPLTGTTTGLTGIQSGSIMTNTTQKQGLVQNVKEHLHMGQQTNMQQTGLINQQSGFVQQPLMTGNTMPLNNQSRPLTTGAPLQSNLGSHNVVTHSTASTGLNATTVTSGAPIQAERSNILQHESKVLNQEGGMLTKSEQSNLLQHEKVVDAFVHGNLPRGNNTLNQPLNTTQPLSTTQPLTTTQPIGTTHTNTFGKPLDDETQKTGFMARMKEKMHRSHNK